MTNDHFDHSVGSDRIEAAGGDISTFPAGTLSFDEFEHTGAPAYPEAGARRQAVEPHGVLGLHNHLQSAVNLSLEALAQRYLRVILSQHRHDVGREPTHVGIVLQQTAVVLLPLVSVRPYRSAAVEEGEHVCQLMEQNQKEGMRVEVSVDTDGVTRLLRSRQSIVAQLRMTLTRYLKMYGIADDILHHIVESRRRQERRKECSESF